MNHSQKSDVHTQFKKKKQVWETVETKNNSGQRFAPKEVVAYLLLSIFIAIVTPTNETNNTRKY
jgi:hypothetical protein